MSKDNSLTELLKSIEPQDNQQGKISLDDLMNALKDRGFGAFLIVPALITLLPTGGIPTVPSVCGVLISLVSVQKLFGNNKPWLPKFIKNITFSEQKFRSGIEWILPLSKILDKLTATRLSWLTQDKALRVIALLCVLTGLSMVPLEIIPFAASIPALSIILFAMGMITRDGIMMLLALMLNLGVYYLLANQFL